MVPTDWLIALALAFPLPLPNTPQNQVTLEAFLTRHDIGQGWGNSVSNLPWLRERVAYILKAPPSVDADRLPSVRWLSSRLDENAHCHERLTALRSFDLHREEEIQAAIETTEFLANYYRAAINAASARDSYQRRDWLMEMRDLSPVWYQSGLFPPSVPVWAFKEVTP